MQMPATGSSPWRPRRPLATIDRKPRQGRKAATVLVDSGAGQAGGAATSLPTHWLKPGPCRTPAVGKRLRSQRVMQPGYKRSRPAPPARHADAFAAMRHASCPATAYARPYGGEGTGVAAYQALRHAGRMRAGFHGRYNDVEIPCRLRAGICAHACVRQYRRRLRAWHQQAHQRHGRLLGADFINRCGRGCPAPTTPSSTAISSSTCGLRAAGCSRASSPASSTRASPTWWSSPTPTVAT